MSTGTQHDSCPLPVRRCERPLSERAKHWSSHGGEEEAREEDAVILSLSE